MEEKERYGCRYIRGEFDVFIDNETDKYLTIQEVKHLLNQQDKRIKELEEENDYFRKENLRDGETFTMSQAKVFDEIKQENQQLKQQLAESEKSNEYFADRIEKADKEIKEIYKKYNELVEKYNNIKEEVDNNFVDGQKYNQLKQQLHDLPNKIVGDCKMALIKRINIISGYGRMTIDEQSFFFENEYGKDLDTIFKKYGGENDL